ncbi:MAG: hypothetical protein DCF22_13890 [Leptolyngbya sp.]|nr:MAG: hypothetical protein DCF22_13890 [Leptolyngbya sp.]
MNRAIVLWAEGERSDRGCAVWERAIVESKGAIAFAGNKECDLWLGLGVSKAIALKAVIQR